jgi:hypothetical protein
MAKSTVIADGSWEFADGVDSQATTTVQSSLVPHGLKRSQLAWLSNATVRGGGILQRTGWLKLLDLLTSGLYQGGVIYEPIGQDTNPYLVVSISGHIYKALLDPPYTVTDLSAQFGVTNPATQPQSYFAEAEGFLIIQAGDGVTLPLFYASAFPPNNQPEFLRRSHGITGSTNFPNINEIPAATAMVYYAGRLWYAQGRIYCAGDMVDNQSSGTAAYQFRDSVLRITENPLAAGGDGFTVPTQAGNIRALAFTANLDTTLGQGPLYIFTRKQVYALNVPVTRTAWIAATNTNQPLQTVSQITSGSVGERCIVHVNGDLFYQSFDPAVRSLIIATRFYQQWGNLSISNNVTRALQFNDRSLMRFASGIVFDNRLLECVLPKQTASGVVCSGILPLDFDLVSTLQDQAPPAWEGIWEGIDILQLFTGDFGGLPRAFAIAVSRVDQSIDVYELSTSSRVDSAGTPQTSDNRVGWFVEFPAFTWGKEFELKQLHGGELWVDKVFGEVKMRVDYRVDADPCWRFWFNTTFCAARNCAEDEDLTNCYPTSPNFREGYKWPIRFPAPPVSCDSMGIRPTNIGFQFQVRITMLGWCRIRGLILWAEMKESQLYDGLSCG